MAGRHRPGAGASFALNMEAWNATVKSIVENELMPRAEAIAAACNEASVSDGGHNPRTKDFEKAGYRASLQDGITNKLLEKHDYHATVITASYAAMADNSRTNRLVENFYHAEVSE